MVEQNIGSFINQILPKSDSEFINKCVKNFQYNGINKGGDLLNLINNSSHNDNNLTNPEKEKIQLLYEKDYCLEEILEILLIQKSEQIKQYFQSIIKPKNLIPKHLTKIEISEYQSLPCFLYPSKKVKGKKYYTLLLLGETGSGKTTLLDAFVNYLNGILFDDEWRYRLSNENKNIKPKCGYSTTNNITPYYINYGRDDKSCEKEINIKIIDTPGFTDEISKNFEIIKQLKNLFKDIGELDYILIVNNSSKTRFTSRDQYILDIIYGIFGKNIIERLMFICTFSDGEKPLVIDTLKSVGYYYFQEYFCFNNSCLYVSNNNADKVTKNFWKIGNTSIKKFLDIIIQKNYLL